jgi:signal transduction histidine kinase
MKFLISHFFVFLIFGSFSQNLFQRAEIQLDNIDPEAIKTIREIAKKEGYSTKLYTLESRFHQNNGNFQKSIVLARKGLKVATSKQKKEPLKLIMINHYLLSNLDSAIHFGQTYLRQNLTTQERSKALVLISNAHWSLGNYNYAEEGYKNALHAGKACKDSLSMSTALNGLGLIHFQNKNSLSKPISFFRRAIALSPITKPINKANYQLNIAGALIEKGEMSFAKKYLTQAEETAKQYNDIELLFSCFVNEGNIYLRTNELKEARKYLKLAENFEKSETLYTSNRENLYMSLSDLEYKEGNFKLSRDYYNKYYLLYNNRINDEKNKKIIILQEQFNTADKKKEIAELKIRNQQSELKQKRLDAAYFKAQSWFLTSLFLVVIIGIIGYLIYRKRSIALQQQAEKDKRKAILDAVEKEKYRFSRELHDSLGGTLSMSKLMVSQYTGNPNTDKIEKLLQIAIDDTRRISRDLYPTVLKISGLKSTLVDLFDTLQLANPNIEFDFAMTDEEVHLEDNLSLHLYRVCQELTNNTIKYADATNVVLEIEIEQSTLKVRYRDNGKGFDINKLKTGVGLNSIQERLSSLNGIISIQSELNKGFEANINLPI